MKDCQAGFELLLADVCRRDPRPTFDRSPKEPVKLQSVSRPQTRKPPEGVAAFFSCSPGEQAYESPKLERGVFFHYVVEGLKGKAAKDGGDAVRADGVRLAPRGGSGAPGVRPRRTATAGVDRADSGAVLTTGHVEAKKEEAEEVRGRRRIDAQVAAADGPIAADTG